MNNPNSNNSKPLDFASALNYLLFAVKKGWKIILLGTILGGIIGYFSALKLQNEYEVRTTFVMNPAEARLEFEKLQSETRLIKTLRSDRKFQMSRRINLGWKGMSEMYQESPFDVFVGDLPSYLLDKPHQISLKENGDYKITWNTGGQTKETQGHFGEATSIGSTEIRIQKTKYWNRRRSDYEYDMIFWSDEALQRRYSHQLQVIYLAERPHRIELSFTDENRQRAIDFLKAYSANYHAENRALREETVDQFLVRSRKEKEFLEKQILSTPISEKVNSSFGNALLSEFPGINDSLKSLIAQEQRLKKRLEVWAELNASNPDLTLAKEKLSSIGLEKQDSEIIQLLGQPSMFSQKENLLVETLEKDRALLEVVNNKLILEIKGQSGEFNTRPFLIATASKFGENQGDQANLILWERYAFLNQEILEANLEVRKNETKMVESDPTHFLPGHGGERRWKNVLFWTVSFFFLAIGLCFWRYAKGSFVNIEQVGLYAKQVPINYWSSKIAETDERKLFANLDIDLGEERKTIAIATDGNPEDLMSYIKSLTTALEGFGHSCLLVNCSLTDELPQVSHLSIPEGVSNSWWMSNTPQQLIHVKAENHDRIIVCLPSLRENPEAIGFLRHVDQAFYIILKGESTTKDWMNWERIADQIKVKFRVLFIG